MSERGPSGTGHDTALERLHEWAASGRAIYPGISADIPYALNEIERLRAENETLRRQVNSGRRAREAAEGLPVGTLPRV